MKLKELFNRFTKDTALGALYATYPDQIKNAGGYELAYDEIMSLKPLGGHKDEMSIKVSYITEDWDGADNPEEEHYFDISGEKQNSDDSWALEFTDWIEWLAMEITFGDEHSRDLDKEVLLAHILYEMTFAGYTNKDIKDRIDSIKKDTDDIKKGLENGSIAFDVDELLNE